MQKNREELRKKKIHLKLVEGEISRLNEVIKDYKKLFKKHSSDNALRKAMED